MTRVSLVVVVLALGLTQAFGQEVEQTLENQPQKGIVGRIVDDLIESTRNVHEINVENFAAERAAFGERHAQATEPNPGFARFDEHYLVKYSLGEILENVALTFLRGMCTQKGLQIIENNYKSV